MYTGDSRISVRGGGVDDDADNGDDDDDDKNLQGVRLSCRPLQIVHPDQSRHFRAQGTVLTGITLYTAAIMRTMMMTTMTCRVSVCPVAHCK